MKTEKYEPKIESEEVKSSKQKNTIFNKDYNYDIIKSVDIVFLFLEISN